ncbi:MAG: hypothetical protein ACYDDO_11835 [Acidiferrobacterales bacterium]
MKIILIISVILLAGCAVNSGVVPIGQETYTVSRQAATGFSGSGDLKFKALVEADTFCKKQGKSLQVVRTGESHPPYVFGNFPKAEVEFTCINANGPELERPKPASH